MPSLNDYRGNYLDTGWHDVVVQTFRMFEAHTGTRGVEFTVANAKGQKGKTSFYITKEALYRLSNFAQACGLSEDQMAAYDPFKDQCHRALLNRRVRVFSEKPEGSKYHDITDWDEIKSTLPPAAEPTTGDPLVDAACKAQTAPRVNEIDEGTVAQDEINDALDGVASGGGYRMSLLTEQVVTMPVVNPATGRCSRTFKFAGRIDAVVGHRLIDYKGTGDPARFIQTHTIGHQADLYALALSAAGIHVTEIEYRLVHIPAIRLCQRIDQMDPEAYRARCFRWITEKVDGLTEHVLPLNSGRLARAAWWLWESSKRILENRRHNRWIENDRACFTWERACPYLPLCECVANDADPTWIVEDQYERQPLHPELGDDSKFGGETLTYTAISTLAQCECRYRWRYEECLHKRQDEDGESQWIGSAMHVGLAAYRDGGESAAFGAVDEWKEKNPVLGEDGVNKQAQNVARARAMIQAVAARWPFAA